MNNKLYCAAFDSSVGDGQSVSYGLLVTGANRAIIHEIQFSIIMDTPGVQYFRFRFAIGKSSAHTTPEVAGTIEKLDPDAPASTSTFYTTSNVGAGATRTVWRYINLGPNWFYKFKPAPDSRIIVDANTNFGMWKDATGSAINRVAGYFVWEEI